MSTAVDSQWGRFIQFIGPFHVRMAMALIAFAVLSFGSCWLGDIRMPDVASSYLIPFILAAMLLPLPFYWMEANRFAYADALLIIIWAWCEDDLIPFLVRATVRARMPLQDHWLGSMDQHLGVSVPAIMQWAERHWLGYAITATYAAAPTFLAAAVIVPLLVNQRHAAKRLIVGNLIAFLLCVPIYTFMPAVGPWRFYHFPDSAMWRYISEPVLYGLRAPGPYILHNQMAGVITFPSFHVVWAMLSATSFWGMRWLRIPACLLAMMIIASTLTTGWHYATDVLGGLVVATVAIFITRTILRRQAIGHTSNSGTFPPE